MLLFGCVIEGISNQQHDFFIKSSEKYLLALESIADSVSKRTDLIAINENSENPQKIYLTHRKGWLCRNAQLTDKLFVNNIRAKHCKYIFICKNDTNVSLPYRKKYSDSVFDVYDITKSSISK